MKEKILNLPNLLTLARLVLAFFIIYNIYIGKNITALILFAISYATELDGTIARKLKQQTAFGKDFDAITDYIWLGGILIMLTIVGKIPLWIMIPAIVLCLFMGIIAWVISKKTKKRIDISFRETPDMIFGGVTLVYIALLLLNFKYADIMGIIWVIALAVDADYYLKKLLKPTSK